MWKRASRVFLFFSLQSKTFPLHFLPSFLVAWNWRTALLEKFDRLRVDVNSAFPCSSPPRTNRGSSRPRWGTCSRMWSPRWRWWAAWSRSRSSFETPLWWPSHNSWAEEKRKEKKHRISFQACVFFSAEKKKITQESSHIAAVVDEAGEVATLGGVYDGVVVDAEHVAAADALLLVALLPHVRDHLKMEDYHLLESFEMWLMAVSDI